MEGTVVLTGEWGALLQYPPLLRVKLVENRCRSQSSTEKAKKRVSKKPRELNDGEKLLSEYHFQIRETLLDCYMKMMEAARTLHYFPVQQHVNTNTGSDVDFAAMCNLASLASDCQKAPILLTHDTNGQEQTDIFGRVISNTCDQQLNLTVFGRDFIIPLQSTFLLSNLHQINPLYNYAAVSGKYDLIIIDPPWENRSAIRGKKYEWLPAERLFELSIQKLAVKGALVAVWVTNKRKLAMFVCQTLFPKWEVCYLAEWHWLKVNTDGDLIHEMDSIHKKPYELVIIGRHMETSVTLSVDSLPPPKRICLQASTSNLLKESPARNFPQCYLTCDSEVTSSERSVYLPIRNHFVFACVASDTHSQKPFLGDLLNEHSKKQGRKLELFARNLQPGWTSWGNEVLMFQGQGDQFRHDVSECSDN